MCSRTQELQVQNLPSFWARSDRVSEQYGGEAPIHDLPGEGGHSSKQPFEVHVANLSAKLILFSKSMLVAEVYTALDYVLLPWREASDPKRLENSELSTNNSCIAKETLQKWDGNAE